MEPTGIETLLTKVALVGAVLLAVGGIAFLIAGGISPGLTLLGIALLTFVMCGITIRIDRSKSRND